MDTIPQLKEEAQQLRKRLEILEQAVENVGNCKRLPEPGEIWERDTGIEVLIYISNNDILRGVELDAFGSYHVGCPNAFSKIATFKRKAQL